MQKAKLDILENIPELDSIGAIEDTSEVPQISAVAVKHWASNKLIIFVSILFLVLLLITGGLWLLLTKSAFIKHKEKIANADGDNSGKGKRVIGDAIEITNAAPPVVALAAKQSTIYLTDFIIDLKDAGGKSKILACDIAIDISERQDASQLVNSTDVRKIIYLAVKGKSAVALRSLEERKRLKKEMNAELEKFFGEGVIENIYFINYLIM